MRKTRDNDGAPPAEAAEPERSESVRSVERALSVLEAISAEPDGATLAQIQVRTGLPLVTAHRLLRTLRNRGYAEQDLETGRWHIGLRVLELRGRVSMAMKLATLARPFLKELMLSSGARGNLALFRQSEVVYVDIVRDLRSLDTYIPPGSRQPAHSTALGKVFLAELTDEQLKRFVDEKGLPARTPNTITTLAGLMRELERIRASGYAVDVAENSPTGRCFAAPVRDYTERVIAAVSLAGDPQSIPDERHPEMIALVTDVARRLSARLGYVPAAETVMVGAAGQPWPAGR